MNLLKERGSGIGVRLGVKTTGCSGLAYVIEFADQIDKDDKVFVDQGVTLIVNPKSYAYLKGTRLDYGKEGINEGFKFEETFNEKISPLLVFEQGKTKLYLGFDNFRVITKYNRSSKYALAVHQLALEISKRFDE